MARELTTIEDARMMVLARTSVLEPEPVPLREALGRILATDVAAADAVPGFDNSAMDGYAVLAADTRDAEAEQRRLSIVDESRAGHPAAVGLDAGEAIAISTGAMLPAGADAVVRVEDTAREADEVVIRAEVTAGDAIRRAGEDVRAGDVVLRAGAELGAAELGALAAVGHGEARCARRPRLTFVLTGDELVEPGQPLGPGQIRNSNAYSVPPLAQEAGGEVTAVTMVGDERAATRAALEGALGDDVVIVSGGVSVGEHDHVRPALESLAVEQVFWGVSLRPGKPTYFGVAPSGALVFGLPGNPVSAMVTFLLFVRPALLAMQGSDPSTARIIARLEADYEKVRGRAEAIRVCLRAGDGGWVATPTGPQGSHVLTSMLAADGLAFAPTEIDVVRAGESIEVELLRPGSPVASIP
ncbi:MAG: molybdopterin molybdotransferase MoeA [Actinomycetota bacterium]|nr:molybdopterin molybdotransferase MoeA [Actinomycetota bacterium]